MYGSVILTLNRMQQSRVCAMEINYLREACSMTRYEGESNVSVYGRCGMRTCANKSRIMSEKNMLRCFGHIERMKNEVCKESV